MQKELTASQVQKKYADKYVELYPRFDYTKQEWLYRIGKVYREVHENTTLGQDVGTEYEYTR